jgi:hypothetical protein
LSIRTYSFPFNMPPQISASMACVRPDFVSDRADASRARHRGREEQVIAGTDPAGVERPVDVAELASLDALCKQPPLKLQQGRAKNFDTSSALPCYFRAANESTGSYGNW